MYVCMYRAQDRWQRARKPRSPRTTRFVLTIGKASPSWHRRRRTLRSRGRKRLQAGERPSASQALLLLRHHASSTVLKGRVRALMGRGEQWDQSGDGWSSQDASWRKRLWKGAYPSPKAGSAPWKKGAGRANADSKPAFPAFDARPPKKGSTAASSRRDEMHETVTGEDGHLVPTVQKALNGARKAENRLAKLVQDRQRAEQQWQDYMQDSKAAYIRERDRFHRAMDHFTKEILEAREFQRQARAVLRHVALEDEERKDMETEEATIEDDEWDRMVKDWEAERESVDDGVLRRALLARETRSTTPAPPTRSVARSPAVPRDAAEKRQDSSYRPMYNESSPVHQARSDPYSMTSPRMEVGRGESLGRPAEPPPSSGMSPVPPVHQTGQGTAAEATGTPMGLAEKLQAKRNALRPFGIPPGLATGDVASKPPVHLEDDDPDLDGPGTAERPSE